MKRMDHEHNYIKGYLLAIVVYMVNLFNGWIDHNGGFREMFYSILTIIVYGFFGAGISYIGNRIWKKLGGKNENSN